MESFTYLYMLIICSQVSVHAVVLNGEQILQKWVSFKSQHSKKYETEKEDARRMKIYLDNVNKIIQHNELFEKGQATYQLGINQFSDLTTEEFAKVYLSKFHTNHNATKEFFTADFSLDNTPEDKDWVEEGKVTSVKNQRSCGSCWAFAVVATIESHIAINTGRLEDLSEQDLVDCDDGSSGCDGGHEDTAFSYVERKGIATEESYPYEAEQYSCRSGHSGASITGYRSAWNEKEMKKVVGSIGPVSVAIDCGDQIQNYESGIFVPESSDYYAGHAVMVVGYGTHADSGMDYWLVKNSWSTSWGEDGYFKIVRNQDACGISNSVYYPTGAR
ncbi:procathepsin L-like [Planococcus citri]|uniref:procathepsin L-like n=1 Tax=Planococcus citri TaxID=170843 RepID=UPI0031F9D96E